MLFFSVPFYCTAVDNLAKSVLNCFISATDVIDRSETQLNHACRQDTEPTRTDAVKLIIGTVIGLHEDLLTHILQTVANLALEAYVLLNIALSKA